ncbi:hypothetical protein HOE425_310162 [Hoeflea sp. EC-HK425]|nr:hypothetical protein HOE425_310162 [Hoeflea sp. EC-HK425]
MISLSDTRPAPNTQSNQQLHFSLHLWLLLLGDRWASFLDFGMRIGVVLPANATTTRRGAQLSQDARFSRRR